ncbi:MAG: carboxypeptidase-like regulatory domain-containing protein, partial [Aureibaculum sp.]
MKKIILFVGFLFHILLIYGQQIPSNKVTVSGKIIDSISKQPIEFATISFEKENKLLGTTSDKDGHFSFNILPGKYKIKIEFLSYEPIVISNKEVRFDTNLG